MLDTVSKSMLRGALASWGVFGYLLGCELKIVPSRLSAVDLFPGLNIALHWQVWLLIGIVLFATRDAITDLHCQICGSRERLAFFRWILRRKLECHPCVEQAKRAAAPRSGQPADAIHAEYAELFEALK